MRRSAIGLLVVIGILGGCKSSTQPAALTSPLVSFSKSTQFGYLVAGGTKWPGIILDTVDGLDSFVYFDFHRSITVTNASSAPQHLKAAWEILDDSAAREMQANKQTASIQGLLWSSNTLDLGILQPNASIILDTTNVVRINQKFEHKVLSYTLQVATMNDSIFQSINARFDSVPFASRYRGYIYTVESAPNPINTFDRPDDGDWQGSPSFRLLAANPNPVSGSTSYAVFTFVASQPVDSLQLDLHITPESIVRSFPLVNGLAVGSHTMTLDLSGHTPGLYAS